MLASEGASFTTPVASGNGRIATAMALSDRKRGVGENNAVRLRAHFCRLRAKPVIAAAIFTFSLLGPCFAAERGSAIPAWLAPHVGNGEGKIALPVLQRARALYQRKVSQGVVNNPCYFAMDATRPSDLGNGQSGRRFFIICEAKQSFSAISSGHGSGRDLKGAADFANGRRCAKNFSNAMGSELTAGGAYVTAETKTSFKGYYAVSSNHGEAFLRSFLQFDGEGETANARRRAIGGHPAQVLRGQCLRKMPGSAYANEDGYAPVGKLVDYTAGRSNGCTSWSPSNARKIEAMTKGNPTTLYIYPESRDIGAVAREVKAGRAPAQGGAYWNASCLGQIGSPRFWLKANLEPIIARYEKNHPAPPPRPLPICKGP